MGEPIRRRIVEVLASGEHQVGNLEEVVSLEFGVGRSATQHHLRVLREHEWVIVRAEETERHYRLAPEVIIRLEKEVRRLRKRWNRRTGFKDGLPPRVGRKNSAPVPPQRPGYSPPGGAMGNKNGSTLGSNRGRRGHGIDPDDPWLHLELRDDDPTGRRA
jgi:DNA-binding transcriptional ArsR family regulator